MKELTAEECLSRAYAVDAIAGDDYYNAIKELEESKKTIAKLEKVIGEYQVIEYDLVMEKEANRGEINEKQET